MKLLNLVVKVSLIIAIAFIGFWAFNPTTAPAWTGFGPYDQEKDGPRSKTLWDWLDLLVVPAFLAVGAFLLSGAQKASEREIEIDRQRQNTLGTFISEISSLLLEKKLRTTKINDEIRSVARTYALTAIRNLDGKRKAEALQFLCEARLISEHPVINLLGSNLTESHLNNANLMATEIKGAYFNKSSFKNANLTKTNLCGSNLSHATFEGATLLETNLSFADLKYSNLKNVDLTRTILDWANLEGADLSGAKVTEEQLKKIESLRKTKLSKREKEKLNGR